MHSTHSKVVVSGEDARQRHGCELFLPVLRLVTEAFLPCWNQNDEMELFQGASLRCTAPVSISGAQSKR